MLEDLPTDDEGQRDIFAGAETAAVVQHGLIPGQLSRGCVVLCGDMLWACLFDVDCYWFAVPLQRVVNLTPTGARKWLSRTDEVKDNERDIRSAVAAMRRATPALEQRGSSRRKVPTGVVAVDVLAPIGEGQAVLVCGPPGAGKSALLRDVTEGALLSNRFGSVTRYSTDLLNPMVDAPIYRARTFTDVVPRPADDRVARNPPAPALVRDLFIALGAAEAVRDSSEHVLVVLDSLAPLLETWLLGVAWAQERRGAPLEKERLGTQRRALFSSVLDRAALLKGGQGSLTMLVGVETDAIDAVGTVDATVAAEIDEDTVFDVDDFEGLGKADLQRLKRFTDRGLLLTTKTLAKLGIPPPARAKRDGDLPEDQERAAVRELQLLSGGQIVLSLEAAAAGDLPAVLPAASFARVGSAKAPSARVNLWTKFASGVRSSSAGNVPQEHAHAIRAALLQSQRAPLLDMEITALLLAASSGVFDALDADSTKTVLRGGSDSPLMQYLREARPELLRRLREEGRSSTISETTVRELDGALRLFMELGGSEAKALPPGASWYLPGSSLDMEGVMKGSADF